ncbi:uncharacterized protein LOC133797103 isoform X2 [Humulus lupulus]|uniref:uncharacterized protein LOC133797103 isoform X2 n=1 Tax=Humulus lupulus TaxID=3486 RepID=UPI002B415D9B|nr:uncharacterized protein LOC133797103 isoform X2 [Humulus lupulus]
MAECENGDLHELLRELPSHAVKELLYIGVCSQCILRLFGIRGDMYDCNPLSPSIFSSVFGDLSDSEKHVQSGLEENEDSNSSLISKGPKVNQLLCSLCLGILQFTYRDDNKFVVRKDSAYEFVASIAELVKQDYSQTDGFSLEVSIPPVTQENDRSIWFYIKEKYGSESWFQRKALSDCISVKDALKASITKPLEKLLDCKSNMSSLRIRLTYSQLKASMAILNFVEKSQADCKRRKTVISTCGGLETFNDGVKGSDSSNVASDVAILETSQDSQISEHVNIFLEKISEPCQFVFHCNRMPIYVGGRYLKYSRNVSQTRWIIDDERMGDASVEELIGSQILPVCQGDNYKFHAAGREDIDVRMLGSGRPFLIEIQNARHVPCVEDVKSIEKLINHSDSKLVGVKNLKTVDSQVWTLMREGESEKQKQYVALVWISRPLKDEDFQSVFSFKEMKVMQKTPIRVLHRRSPLEREKIIHWMKMEKVVGSSQYFLLHLCTQAGTYIKEFVHGDLGRTHPSIGSILGCRAEILQLDVTDVKMDCFLDDQC